MLDRGVKRSGVEIVGVVPDGCEVSSKIGNLDLLYPRGLIFAADRGVNL